MRRIATQACSGNKPPALYVKLCNETARELRIDLGFKKGGEGKEADSEPMQTEKSYCQDMVVEEKKLEVEYPGNWDATKQGRLYRVITKIGGPTGLLKGGESKKAAYWIMENYNTDVLENRGGLEQAAKRYFKMLIEKEGVSGK